MSKVLHEKFESLDHYKGNDAFREYVDYHDNMLDPRVKDANLKKSVCKMPLARKQRRAVLVCLNSPLE